MFIQVGIITLDGMQIGTISADIGGPLRGDDFIADFSGYVPMGRADRGLNPAAGGHRYGHGRGGRGYRPHGKTFDEPASRTYPQGSAETDRAIVEAARAHHLDPNFMRSVASIESGMNPNSNANRTTQYKGLYQIGHDEWRRVGNGGNIYSAHENAMGAARLFEANRNQFRERFGRDPTDAEMYMMHQQGLGFYTRSAMTNIGGNPYPGMHGPQTHESFEAGWGREVARRKAAFAASHPEPKQEAQAPASFDPETMVP